MSAIGYVRVSTEQQAIEGVSLEAQQAKIEAWCNVNDYKLDAIFMDAGVSGKRMDKRPGLQQALAAIRKGDVLVVYSLSRLARSTKDTLSISEHLEKVGADLASISERIDTVGAAGKMVFRMLAVLAEFERDVIIERTTTSMRYLKANGKAYSAPPFGFRLIGDLLVAVTDEQAVLEEIQARNAAGDSLRSIAADLNARGVPGKNGGKWHASTVKYILGRLSNGPQIPIPAYKTVLENNGAPSCTNETPKNSSESDVLAQDMLSGSPPDTAEPEIVISG